MLLCLIDDADAVSVQDAGTETRAVVPADMDCADAIYRHYRAERARCWRLEVIHMTEAHARAFGIASNNAFYLCAGRKAVHEKTPVQSVVLTFDIA